jgi:hypothetical protein
MMYFASPANHVTSRFSRHGELRVRHQTFERVETLVADNIVGAMYPDCKIWWARYLEKIKFALFADVQGSL